MDWYACTTDSFFCNLLLNQVRAGLWATRTWFLKIDPVRIVSKCVFVCVCVCVCVCLCVGMSTPKAINPLMAEYSDGLYSGAEKAFY